MSFEIVPETQIAWEGEGKDCVEGFLLSIKENVKKKVASCSQSIMCYYGEKEWGRKVFPVVLS